MIAEDFKDVPASVFFAYRVFSRYNYDMGKSRRMILLVTTGFFLVLAALYLGMIPPNKGPQASIERELRGNVRESPEDAYAITRLGMFYWGKGKKPAALREFKKALKINPDIALPYYFLGEACFMDRDNENASRNYSLFMAKMDSITALSDELKDQYISALHKMGRNFWSMKEYEHSYRATARIIELDPGDLSARYNLAVYYYNRQRNRGKAFKELEFIISRAPSSRTAAKAEFFMDYMRRNPDPRIIGDFSFIDEN